MPTPELVSLIARLLTGEQQLLAELNRVADASLTQLTVLRYGRCLDAFRAQGAIKHRAMEAAQQIDRALAPLREESRQSAGLSIAARDQAACLADQQCIVMSRISDSERAVERLYRERFAQPLQAREEVALA
jgi:hypothetical protein